MTSPFDRPALSGDDFCNMQGRIAMKAVWPGSAAVPLDRTFPGRAYRKVSRS
jgi:hypothetical protein